jgi:hypothetical protein
MSSVTSESPLNKLFKDVSSNSTVMVGSVFSLLLILYASVAAPKLPKKVAEFFDNSLVKLLYMFMIAYLATKNPALSLIVSVILLLTIQTLSTYDTAEKVVKGLKNTRGFVERDILQLDSVRENKPVQPVQPKPVQPKPVQPKPEQPIQPKPVQPQPVQSKPAMPPPESPNVKAQQIIDKLRSAYSSNKDTLNKINANENNAPNNIPNNVPNMAPNDMNKVNSVYSQKQPSNDSVKLDINVVANKIKENFGDVVIHPNKLRRITETLENAASNMNAAVNAVANNDQATAAKLQNNAKMLETQATCMVKVDALSQKAKEAQNNGDQTTAQTLSHEAAKNNMVVDLITKSQDHLEHARKFSLLGKHDEAEKHMAESAQLDRKVNEVLNARVNTPAKPVAKPVTKPVAKHVAKNESKQVPYSMKGSVTTDPNLTKDDTPTLPSGYAHDNYYSSVAHETDLLFQSTNKIQSANVAPTTVPHPRVNTNKHKDDDDDDDEFNVSGYNPSGFANF